jgi:hypothetical protein
MPTPATVSAPAAAEIITIPPTGPIIVVAPPTQAPAQKDIDDEFYYFTCPHCACQGQVKKTELNCTIFRHAYYRQLRLPTAKSTDAEKKEMEEWNKTVNPQLAGQPIGPHTSKEECESLTKAGLIVGCCKAVKFDGKTAVACDYTL